MLLNKLLGFIVTFLKRKEMDSELLRYLFYRKYDISVGLYSYGCFDMKRMARGMIIGRYCSFSQTCHFFPRNHGLDYIMLHPYLYNSKLGLIKEDTIENRPCVVEDDVWIGHNAIILPSVRIIGRGSVIAAGSVLTKDVPRYAVMAGNPAKIIKFRFTDEVCELLESKRYWELNKAELADLIVHNKEKVFNPGKINEKY